MYLIELHGCQRGKNAAGNPNFSNYLSLRISFKFEMGVAVVNLNRRPD
jgi:hypothetical protein